MAFATGGNVRSARSKAFEAKAERRVGDNEMRMDPAGAAATPLSARGRYQCAWPVDGEADGAMVCCGRPVDRTATRTTASYCPQHRERAARKACSPAEALRSMEATMRAVRVLGW
ncbi:hypothetical protein [Brevundimonas faecalis]|uniref:GcrA cell cycle regulator n=1 Tax=Brevundimonas faecalis TaxID=947378 RepID=A0ABV2RB13_9CAUL